MKSWCCSIGVFLLLLSMPVFAGSETAPQTKPAITGLIDMQAIAWHNTNDSEPVFTLSHVSKYPGMFGGVVLNATWHEMQPQSGGPLVTTRVDRAIAKVRAYNATHPQAPLGIKLRIYQGNQAPLWAKEIDGPPLKILRNSNGCPPPAEKCPIKIGRVWDPDYIAAWRAFLALVAARYDNVPVIRAVAITSCAMETDEPFVMPVEQHIPGYTDAADQACLMGAVDDYAAWHRTAIDYTINVFISLQGNGSDLNFSKSVMNACRNELGRRCELGNHAFSPDLTGENAEIVAAISSKGAPIHYQTMAPKASGLKWDATVKAAHKDHATGLELWPEAQFGGFITLSPQKIEKLAGLLKAPITP